MTRLTNLVAALVLPIVGYSLRRPYWSIIKDCRVEVVPAPLRVPDPNVSLGEHTYADGLLVVNPDGRHPIFDLRRHAVLNFISGCSSSSTPSRSNSDTTTLVTHLAIHTVSSPHNIHHKH
ncbi:hypothetical protein BDZ89DRAFT_1066817 [Hymenopellis radicata]|nr:hypothetical protein BDZ89DRAFT_1066817 [Hymenopellis radicata]